MRATTFTLKARSWTIGLLATMVAWAGLLPFTATDVECRDRFFLEVALASSSDGRAQLYWDAGRGLSEADSGDQEVMAGHDPRLYRFGLPIAVIHSLRFDLIDRDATLTMSLPRVVDHEGRVVRTFGPDEVKAANEIADLTREGSELRVTTAAGARDPSVELRLTEPLRLWAPWYATLPTLAWWVAVLAGALFIFLALPRPDGAIIARLQPAIQAAQRRPIVALLVAAALVVIVQAWPVVFAGRSFVSPANGGYLLYGWMPTVPGSTAETFEDGRGSDVGAILFSHQYSPMLTREAWRHGEWPLWNRSSLTGTPLLGQGQSMVGDPFNLLTVAADGAAWAWDLRFLLARFALAAGLGLTVWLLTRHGGAALLTVVAGGFWGYFTYRLNHPANFSVGYAPWILFAWVLLTRATTARQSLIALAALVVANWVQLASGTMKEATMLMAGLNLAGLLLVLRSEHPIRHRVQLVMAATGAGVVLVLMSAPLWLSFLVALGDSYTGYAEPRVEPYDTRELIGLFEELFPSQSRDGETVAMPSTNGLVLLGVLSWVVVWRGRWWHDRVGSPLALVAVGLAAFAFGWVPGAWITATPFLGNIIHTGNTFSSVLIVLLAVLGGWGFAAIAPAARRADPRQGLIVVLLAAGLVALFALVDRPASSRFFLPYVTSLGLASLALIASAWVSARWRQPSVLLAGLLLALPLLLWRHAQWTSMPFDRYVFNPGERVDLRAASAAVEFVNAVQSEPGRVIGLHGNLFPSYPIALGWEGLYGAEALRSPTYRELADAVPLPGVGTWAHRLTATEARELLPILDLLNVTHYLATPGHAEPPDHLTLLARHDLDVFASESAWPRAYFTDRIHAYEAVDDFVAQVRRAPGGEWRAAVQQDDPEVPGVVKGLLRRRTNQAVPARDYVLTPNTTSFTIDAPGPGVVVLTEAYFPGHFRLRVNGQPASYFRVNHAFKGLLVTQAGTYHITYTYWPVHFTLSLWLMLLGGVLAVTGACGWRWWWRSSHPGDRGQSPVVRGPRRPIGVERRAT